MDSKNISTLIKDIENLLENGIEDIPNDLINKFGIAIANDVKSRLLKSNRNKKSTLRMSSIGRPCERQLWYSINSPEIEEPLKSEHHLKFIYGSIIEELMLFLTELSGHEVTGRQDEQEIEGIKGHRDAIIDGVLVDVKSASSYSYKKFKEGRLKDDDAFGYIPQIMSYLYSSQADENLKDKDRAAFLVVDKTLGHFCLDFHEKDTTDWPGEYARKKDMVAGEIPDRAFEAEDFGASGNKKLPINCSYCPSKKTCWPGLRTFAYSYGPVFLTEVKNEPKVPELT